MNDTALCATFDVHVMVNREGIFLLCLKHVNRYFTLQHSFGKGSIGKVLEITQIGQLMHYSAKLKPCQW